MPFVKVKLPFVELSVDNIGKCRILFSDKSVSQDISSYEEGLHILKIAQLLKKISLSEREILENALKLFFNFLKSCSGTLVMKNLYDPPMWESQIMN